MSVAAPLKTLSPLAPPATAARARPASPPQPPVVAGRPSRPSVVCAGLLTLVSAAAAVGVARGLHEPAPAPTASPAVAAGGEYRDVGQLERAFVAAGGWCPDYAVLGASGGSSAADCSATVTLEVFSSRRALVTAVRTTAPAGTQLLVGHDWVVSGSPADISAVRAGLGGTPHGPALGR